MALDLKVMADSIQADGLRLIEVEDPAVPGVRYGVRIKPGSDPVAAMKDLIAKRKAVGIDYPGKPISTSTVLSIP